MSSVPHSLHLSEADSLLKNHPWPLFSSEPSLDYSKHNFSLLWSTTVCSVCLAHLGHYSTMAVLGVKRWCIRHTIKEGQLQLPRPDPKEWHLGWGDGVPLTWLSQHSYISQNAHCRETQVIHMSRMHGSPILGSFLPPSICQGSLTGHQEVD